MNNLVGPNVDKLALLIVVSDFELYHRHVQSS